MELGRFTKEDSKSVLDARDEFDRHYQYYLAELDIVRTILENAITQEELKDS
jgi:hypothetical protein